MVILIKFHIFRIIHFILNMVFKGDAGFTSLEISFTCVNIIMYIGLTLGC